MHVRQSTWPFFLLFFASLSLCWLGNDRVRLWDRDEPRYAETARQMLLTQNWIVPYFNEEFRYQKPVLTYWLVAFAYKILGETEFAARAVSGLAFAWTCLLTARLGERMAGRGVGLAAGVALALCPGGLLVGKLCLPDGPLLLFSTLCFSCLYKCKMTACRETGWAALGFWIALSASILTKGPVVPGMILAFGVVFCVWNRTSPARFALRWRLGAFVFFVLTVPWFLAVYYAAGPGFFVESLGKQVAGRLTSSFDGRSFLPGYYAGSAILGFAPWLGPLVIGLFPRKQPAGEGLLPEADRRFLVAWVLGPMFLLELFRSKQAHYFVPAYPALAILAGVGAVQMVRSRLAETVTGYLRTLLVWDSALLVGILTLVGAVAWLGADDLLELVVPAALVVAVGAGAAIELTRRRRLGLALAGKSASLALAWVLAFSVSLPQFDSHRIVRPVALALRDRAAAEQAPVVQHQLFEPSMVFYSRRSFESQFFPEDYLRQLSQLDRDSFAALTDAEFLRLKKILGDRLVVEQSWFGWVKMHTDRVHLTRIRPARDADHTPRTAKQTDQEIRR